MNERVLSGKFKKVYSKEEIKDWVRFGFEMNVIDKTDKKGIMNWIKMLNSKNINLQINGKQILQQKTTIRIFRNQYW